MFRAQATDSLIHWYANGTSVTSATFVNYFQNLDNQWIHIVTVFDYANKRLYIYRNGVQFGATANLTGIPLFPSTNRSKTIGSLGTGNKLTDGSLDEVRIYNRGLSAEEISAQYTITKGKFGL